MPCRLFNTSQATGLSISQRLNNNNNNNNNNSCETSSFLLGHLSISFVSTLLDWQTRSFVIVYSPKTAFGVIKKNHVWFRKCKLPRRVFVYRKEVTPLIPDLHDLPAVDSRNTSTLFWTTKWSCHLFLLLSYNSLTINYKFTSDNNFLYSIIFGVYICVYIYIYV